jgi:putative acetyltransferase
MASGNDERPPTSGIVVRPERRGEEDAVRAVNAKAFGQPVEGRIVDDIRGTDRWIPGGSFVAELGARIVGHLLLSEGDLISDNGVVRRIWMVGPVAVVPEQQRRGIGGALMGAAIDFATQREQPVLCLLGHADYYPRFGFEPARRIGIEPPKPWSDRNWLALRLPSWDPGLRGVAHFPPAFAE